MEMQKQACGNFAKGLLFGGILGAAASVFLFPKCGRELRSEIKNQGERAFEKAKNLYTDTQHQARTLFRDVTEKVKSHREKPSAMEGSEEGLWEA